MRPLAFTLLLIFALVAHAANAHSVTTRGSSKAHFDAPTKASKADPPLPVAVAGVLEDDLAGSCSLEAALAGNARKGVKATFDAILIDAFTGNTITSLGTASGKTKKDGLLTVDYPIPRRAGFAQMVALTVEVSLGGGKKVTSLELACELFDATP